MRFYDAVEDSVPELLKLADLLKRERPSLTDFEALKIAVDIWKADSLEAIGEIAVYLDDTNDINPLSVKIVSDD